MRWNPLSHGLSIVVVTLAVLTRNALGATNDQSSYSAIPERNLFGLRQPQPQAKPDAPAPALPKLTLTGITTILDTKRALLKGPALSAPPGAPDQSFILTEGQREDYLEVVSINEDAGSVSLLNCGIPVVLTLDKDGPKLPATPAPGVPPANPGANVAAVPLPSPDLQAPPRMAPGMRQVPTRTYQPPSTLPNPLQTNVSPAQAAASSPFTNSYLPPTGYVQQLPSAVIGQPIAPVIGAEHQLSPEEQAALLEIQRELRDTQQAPIPPLPPTGLSEPRLYQGDVPVATPGANPNRTPPFLPQ